MADLTIRDCIEALRPVALQARSAIRLSEALESLGSIENHSAELSKEVEDKKREVTELETRSVEVTRWCAEKLEETNKQAFKIVTDAQLAATETMRLAHEQETFIHEQAQASVDLLAVEKHDLDVARTDLTAEVAKLSDQRNALQDEITRMREKVAGL